MTKTVGASKQAFVAMWFDPKVEAFCKEGIKTDVEDCGYECRRINAVEHNNNICDAIIAEIRKSRFWGFRETLRRHSRWESVKEKQSAVITFRAHN